MYIKIILSSLVILLVNYYIQNLEKHNVGKN